MGALVAEEVAVDAVEDVAAEDGNNNSNSKIPSPNKINSFRTTKILSCRINASTQDIAGHMEHANTPATSAIDRKKVIVGKLLLRTR